MSIYGFYFDSKDATSTAVSELINVFNTVFRSEQSDEVKIKALEVTEAMYAGGVEVNNNISGCTVGTI